MKFEIYYNELSTNNAFSECIFTDLEVVSYDDKNKKRYSNIMSVCLLSLDSLKEKWAKNPNAKNAVCVGGHVFTLNPLSPNSLVVKNSNGISLEAIRHLLKSALKDKKINSLFDIRLALFPIIKCVYMDNVDESFMTFYEFSMNPEYNNSLPLNWSIQHIEKSKMGSNHVLAIRDLTEVHNIESKEKLKLTLELVMPSGKPYQAEISFVGMDYFFHSCDKHFQTSSNLFYLNTSLHVVSCFSSEVVLKFMMYIFDKVARGTEKEILIKLSAFTKILSINTNSM